MNKAQKGVFYTVLAAAIGFLLVAWWEHFAVALADHEGQTHIEQLAESNKALLDELGKRALAEDAALEERIKLCKTGAITTCRICRDIGIDIVQCHK